MRRLPPHYGTRILVALASLAAFGLAFAIDHDISSMFVMSVLFMVALAVGGWALGRVGGAILGAGFMLYVFGLMVAFGVESVAYWGEWGALTPAMIGMNTAFCLGLGWLVGAAADFSRESRQRAEELAVKNKELQDAAARLAQSEEMFRQFADRIDVGAWIQPSDKTRAGYQNPAAARLYSASTTGSSEDALTRYLARVHPLDLPVVRASATALRHGEPQDIEYRTLDGARTRWFRSQAFPIRSANGELVSFVGLIEDITDRKEREAEREVLERRERLSSLGSLVAGVAHEVNNPLTYLVGNLALARKEVERSLAGGEGAEAHLRRADKLLASAAGGGERIARIVKALRAVTQSRSSAERTRVELNALASNVRELMNVNLPEDVSIDLELDAQEPAVLARSDELHQVVLNLATNAVQALRETGGHVRITTSTANGHAMLHVVDDGPGMTDETRRKLFTPFFTTKADGTGLGLSIVHGIVRDHDGEIEVDSRVGIGTDVLVRFPVAPALVTVAARSVRP